MWNPMRNLINQNKWARWSKTPKDLVILHTFGKASNVPSASPFVMKLQTYLRMTKIPHKTDSKDMLGPKGKAPWISLNGLHIGDSELCIKHLNGHFNIDLKGPYSESQLAVSTCVKVTLEEHFMWGFAMERFVFNPTQFPKIVGVSPLYDWALMTFGRRMVSKRAKGQGIGLHSQKEIEELCSKDLRAVSAILGENEFLLGKVPCEADCSIFGLLSVVLWGLPNSPYEKLLKDELHNLRDYCFRMKEVYYPDWENCIRKPRDASKISSSNAPQKLKAKL